MSNGKFHLNVGRFAVSIMVIVVAALLIAEAVVGMVTNTSLFFQGVNRGFEFLVGIIFVVIGASLLDLSREYD